MAQDREPLTTYEQALWRLVQWSYQAQYSAEQLELAVQVVADVFWLSDAKVRHDMLKKRATLGGQPRPLNRRASGVRHELAGV